MANSNWVIDPSHSEVHFKIKHLVISTVTGSFKEFSGTATSDDSFENLNVAFEANVASIETNSEQRDNHLKSGDFFDAENFPKITFTGAKALGSGQSEFDLKGEITLKGVTKPIVFKVVFDGIATDPYGQVKAGFEVTGKLNRHDFGLTWSAFTEAGGAVVSDEVKLIGNIQLIKQA